MASKESMIKRTVAKINPEMKFNIEIYIEIIWKILSFVGFLL